MSTHVKGFSWQQELASMARRFLLSICVPLVLCSGGGARMHGQEGADLRVVVSMVQLNVAVTDKNGGYITGLRPKDFVITEDGITEKMATFAEGNAPVHDVSASDLPAGPIA